MNMPLPASINGTAAIRAPARTFVNAFVRRVEAGLLMEQLIAEVDATAVER